MLDPRTIATQGLNVSPRLVAVQGLWPVDVAAPPVGARSSRRIAAPGRLIGSIEDEDEWLMLIAWMTASGRIH